jgi:hypothetical protein
MNVEQALVQRINDLIEESRNLRRTNEHGQAMSDAQQHECVGWVAAALNAVQIACGSETNAYWKKVQALEGMALT